MTLVERRRWVCRNAQPTLRSVARRANHLGNLSSPVSSPFRKNILIFRKPKSVYIPHRSRMTQLRHSAGSDIADAQRAELVVRLIEDRSPLFCRLLPNYSAFPRRALWLAGSVRSSVEASRNGRSESSRGALSGLS
jgi:hypothetical protein